MFLGKESKRSFLSQSIFTTATPASQKPPDNNMTTLSSAARSGEEIGSVFLVAEDGTLLSLPIPSNSPDDPLSWSLRKRCVALAILVTFGIFSMAIQQLPGLLFVAFEREFGKEVGPVLNPIDPSRSENRFLT